MWRGDGGRVRPPPSSTGTPVLPPSPPVCSVCVCTYKSFIVVHTGSHTKHLIDYNRYINESVLLKDTYLNLQKTRRANDRSARSVENTFVECRL